MFDVHREFTAKAQRARRGAKFMDGAKRGGGEVVEKASFTTSPETSKPSLKARINEYLLGRGEAPT